MFCIFLKYIQKGNECLEVSLDLLAHHSFTYSAPQPTQGGGAVTQGPTDFPLFDPLSGNIFYG